MKILIVILATIMGRSVRCSQSLNEIVAARDTLILLLLLSCISPREYLDEVLEVRIAEVTVGCQVLFSDFEEKTRTRYCSEQGASHPPFAVVRPPDGLCS